MVRTEQKNNEELLYFFIVAASLDSLHHAWAEFSPFRNVMLAVCSMPDVNWRKFVEDHESEHGESISELAYFVLVDPSYNMNRLQNDHNSSQDRFFTDDRKAISNFCRKVLKLAAHCHICCAAFQIRSWYKVLEMEVDVVQRSCESGSGSNYFASRRDKPLCEVESIPL